MVIKSHQDLGRFKTVKKNNLSAATLVFFLKSISLAETPQGVFIQNIQAVGSGCLPDSYAASISPDGQSFSLLLDHYEAAISLQTPVAQQTCQFIFNFHVPLGWTFSLITADYRGFAYAELGTLLSQQALYSFEGSRRPEQRREHKTEERHSFRPFEIKGPYNDNYTLHQELDSRAAPWSPCNASESQTLTMTTSLSARSLRGNSNLQAQISLDSLDGNIMAQNFKFGWKRCGSKRNEDQKKNDDQEKKDGGKRTDENKRHNLLERTQRNH
jgi:hypothetical protein